MHDRNCKEGGPLPDVKAMKTSHTQPTTYPWMRDRSSNPESLPQMSGILPVPSQIWTSHMASSNTNLGVVLGASTAVSGWPSSQSHELKKLLSHRTHAAPFSALLQCLDVRLSSPWAGQGSQVVEGQHAEWEKEEPKWVAYLAMGYVTGSGRRE